MKTLTLRSLVARVPVVVGTMGRVRVSSRASVVMEMTDSMSRLMSVSSGILAKVGWETRNREPERKERRKVARKTSVVVPRVARERERLAAKSTGVVIGGKLFLVCVCVCVCVCVWRKVSLG